MTNSLPESARRHLQSQVVDAHPDAGLLTAFAEQSLTGAERELVLQHLAACAGCREVVALAAPAEVSTEAPVVVAPSWFRSPMLHWAAVAATAVIVWAAVSVLAPRTTNRDVAAPAESVAKNEAEPRRDQIAPSAPAVNTQPMKKNEVAARQKTAARPAEAMAAQNVPTAAQTRELDTMRVTAQNKAAGMAAEEKQPMVSAEQAVAPGIVGGAVRKDSAVLVGKTKATALISGTVSDPSGAVVPNALVKITNPQYDYSTEVRTDVTGTYRTPVPPGIYSVEATSPGMQPAKTDEINVDGSVAQNLTLRPAAEAQAVTVTAAANMVSPALPIPPPSAQASSAPVANTLATRKSGAQSDVAFTGLSGAKTSGLTDVAQWRIGEGGALEHFENARAWQKVEVVPGMTFRAVASGGGAVWVGGPDGALFHGADEGRTWHRVRVGPKDAPVSDSITAIAVPSAKSVVVTTSSGEQWSSSDAGHTWKRLTPRR